MLPLKRRTNSFTPPPTALERQLVPVVSTMLGSMTVLFPVVATEPLLPPFGLMFFLGWRLLRGDIWPLWAGLFLGAFDDLFSGQPIGTAMCGWTVILLAIDALDRRMPWRDHKQDWAIAVFAIAGYLLFALLIARATGGDTSPLVLVPQFILSILLVPIVGRSCAALDRWRGPRRS
jgi:rod shape-determining protein MreD